MTCDTVFIINHKFFYNTWKVLKIQICPLFDKERNLVYEKVTLFNLIIH